MSIVVDNKIDLANTINYRLSIQSDLNGFSFTVADIASGEILYLQDSDYNSSESNTEEFLRHTSAFVKSVPLLSKKFAEVIFIADTEKFTLVPVQLLKEKEILKQLSELFTINDDEEVSWSLSESKDIAVLYAANSTLLNIITQYQREFKVVPSVIPVMSLLKSSPEFNKLYIGRSGNNSTIAVYTDKNLLFCNSFPSGNFETSLYFAFSALKQTYINPENTTVYIHGDISEGQIKLLTTYFPLVKYLRNQNKPLHSAEAELKYSFLNLV